MSTSNNKGNANWRFVKRFTKEKQPTRENFLLKIHNKTVDKLQELAEKFCTIFVNICKDNSY